MGPLRVPALDTVFPLWAINATCLVGSPMTARTQKTTFPGTCAQNIRLHWLVASDFFIDFVYHFQIPERSVYARASCRVQRSWMGYSNHLWCSASTSRESHRCGLHRKDEQEISTDNLWRHERLSTGRSVDPWYRYAYKMSMGKLTAKRLNINTVRPNKIAYHHPCTLDKNVCLL